MKTILILMHHAESTLWFRKELIEALCKEHRVYLSVPDSNKIEKELPQNLTCMDVNINRRGMNPIRDYELYRAYCRQIKQTQPDVILSFTIKPNIYGSFAAKKYGVPIINNVTGLGSAFEKRGSIVFKLVKMFYKVALSSSSNVFFQNEEGRDTFLEYGLVKSEKVQLLPGSGVNTERFAPISGFENDEQIRFLLIGRLMKEKGILEFLSAAEKVHQKNLNTVFKVMGMVEEEELLEKIKQTNFVEYLGQLKDPRTEMAKASCIVLPSYHEGMANTLLEGAAMEKPLIATNIHGCKEAIEEGKNGFLCKPRDAESLERAMIEFVELNPKERSEMGIYGRKKMLQEFDRSIVINKYKYVIEQTVHKI